MAMRSHSTVVGVFHDHQHAQSAVNELKRMGFVDDHIGVARRDSDEDRGRLSTSHDASDETYAGEGTAAGLATGAGVGALWGLGIIAGVLPAVGPAIAGGTLAAILSSAAAGAVAAGLGGALIGLGLSKEEAEFYNTEFESGRTVVTVTAPGREREAESILRHHGGYDISRGGMTSEDMNSEDMNSEDMNSEMSSGDYTSSRGDQGMTGMIGDGRTGHETRSGMSGSGLSGHGMGSAGMAADMGGSLAGADIRNTGMSSLGGSDIGSSGMTASDSPSLSRSEMASTGMGQSAMGGSDRGGAVMGGAGRSSDMSNQSESPMSDDDIRHRTIDIALQREEVVIQRRDPSCDLTGGSGEGVQGIHVPVREDQVSAEKLQVAKEDADPDVPVHGRRGDR